MLGGTATEGTYSRRYEQVPPCPPNTLSCQNLQLSLPKEVAIKNLCVRRIVLEPDQVLFKQVTPLSNKSSQQRAYT